MNANERPNLATLLIEHPCPDAAGLIHTRDRSMRAGEARALAYAVAQQLPIERGQAVAVQLPNGPELVATMVGVWLAGGVHVPVNPRLPGPEVGGVLAATRPAALVTTAGTTTLDDPAPYPEDVAFVMWTSGTTGAPKAIHHTHTGYFELLDRVLTPLRGSRVPDPSASSSPRPTPSPNLIPVSMALNAGLYNVLFGLRAGAALVIMDGFDPEEFAELVQRFEIRSTVLPPAGMVMLNESSVDDLGPLKYVRSITAPLSPLHARRFVAKFGVHVLNGYGQAEIGEVIGWTAADAKTHSDKVGAIGRPHPGVEVRIDPDGHLRVKPPTTATGLGDRFDADGFLDTGDLAHIDADGFVWIDGRAGDVINRGGNKVFPEAVEEVLRLAPGVKDAAVVGVADDRLGEVPVAFLVGEGGPTEALDALCRSHLVAYKVPVEFRWIDVIPRNEIGKVLRSELTRSVGSPDPTS